MYSCVPVVSAEHRIATVAATRTDHVVWRSQVIRVSACSGRPAAAAASTRKCGLVCQRSGHGAATVAYRLHLVVAERRRR